jgi:hypothetical protein
VIVTSEPAAKERRGGESRDPRPEHHDPAHRPSFGTCAVPPGR